MYIHTHTRTHTEVIDIHIIPFSSRSYKDMTQLLLLSRFSCVRLCDPIDGSPPGSPVPGILQARTLEWVAISSSNAGKWKVKVKSLSRVWLLATPWTTAQQALHPWDFPGKSTGVGCHCLLRMTQQKPIKTTLSYRSGYMPINAVAIVNHLLQSVIHGFIVFPKH